MTDRTAINTIKGYFYQFDYYILQILKCENEEDIVIIEGIEDVDIRTASEETAVQCKYYAGTEYNHSILKDPIIWMIKHFKDNQSNNYKYKIYGHYQSGQEKLERIIDVEFLKKMFLTRKKDKIKYEIYKELKLSDEQLSIFLQRLTVNIKAPEYDVQNKEIFEEIKKIFACDDSDAEFYYNNALRLTKEKSMNAQIEDRKISKKDFLHNISNKQELFNNWYLEFIGRDKFLKLMKKKYFSEFNLSPNTRFILVECGHKTNNLALKQMIINISSKLSRISKREKDSFCPYIYLYGIDENKLIQVKQMLRADGVNFIDGFNFKGADFDLESILIDSDCHNQIKMKIINDVDDIENILNRTTNTRKIFQFYINEPFYSCSLHEHNKIPIKSVSDILEII
ncbi:hypothetical protein RU86_GL000524 [Lactococcus piscium]|uniref:CD-NTase associated protein 4-like DNA endonuclease domain-containing protein n=1 Tax=Pseudolactococcus piscium TaxID=1364 RepID=A0A2A5RXR3_9LACT|nr:DUF4297 family anti-phage-associated protein [Lactococcus piscium]PCS06019.1 hypothetical protein RU86_GL000524 [Lactococcus piscium]